MTRQEVLEAALHLDPGEQERLIEQLLEILVKEKDFASDDLQRAWLSEIQRRSAEIDAGTAELVEWSAVRERIEARRSRH
jgi:hypothetical protein